MRLRLRSLTVPFIPEDKDSAVIGVAVVSSMKEFTLDPKP